MNTGTIVLIIILVILIALAIGLYFLNKKLEKRSAENQAQMEAAKQTISLLIIDKKKLRMKDSGLPEIVIQSTPRYLRWSKMPVVKAKAGPKIMTFMCDANVYKNIPLKKEVKAYVSGIYITGFKPLRGMKIEEPTKKSFIDKWRDKLNG